MLKFIKINKLQQKSFFGPDIFNKLIQEHRPAVIFLDIIDIFDRRGKLINQFPYILPDMFWLFDTVLTILHEQLKMRHPTLQEQTPDLYTRFITQHSLLTNGIEPIRAHVHTLEIMLLFNFALEFFRILWQVFGGVTAFFR